LRHCTISLRGSAGLAELIDVVRAAAHDKKAEDLTEIDVRGRTILADTFVILTGRSRVQVRSIADGIGEAVEAAGFEAARTEGLAEGGWILIDLGSVVVHVFTPEQRSFYNIERLWSAVADQRARSS
jgi:ribosome-associated protein